MCVAELRPDCAWVIELITIYLYTLTEYSIIGLVLHYCVGGD